MNMGTIFPQKPMVPLSPDRDGDSDPAHYGGTAIKSSSRKRSIYGIKEYQAVILDSIANYQFTIIRAQCGFGKSTQVPQYIIEEARRKNEVMRIIVITPWRPSAITSSAWIAMEFDEVVGQTVGYQTHLESLHSPAETLLTFCSPNAFLRSVIPSSPATGILANTTHIILDEVHERSSDYDVVIALVKEISRCFPKLKVILMGSYFEIPFFVKYFTGESTVTCNTIDIPKVFDNVVTRHAEEFEDKGIMDICRYHWTKNILQPREVLNYQLIINILKMAHKMNTITSESILVFLPGYEEIVRLLSMIVKEAELGGTIIQILHEETAPEEINHSITSSKSERRSILLATRVAETSIIINDTFFVIDTGIALHNKNGINHETQNTKYQWISKASAVQRVGRISQNIKNGFVYRLYEKNQYLLEFKEYQIPGILSEPLEEAVLRLIPLLDDQPKTSDICHKIIKFFYQLPHTPTKLELFRAIESLIASGALSQYARMNPLGNMFLDFPMEPQLSKMLILSAILKCLDPVLTIVSFMITGEPFIFEEDDRLPTEQVRIKKREFAFETYSDHVALVMCFQEWEKMRAGGEECEQRFCRDHYLRASVFESTYAIRIQNLAYLRAIGLVRHSGPGNVDDLNTYSNNWPLVRAIILAGLNKNLVYLGKSSCELELDFEFEWRKEILIAPTSVNYVLDPINLRNHPFVWLVFDEYSMEGENILIRGISYIDPITVALFGFGFWEEPRVTRISDTESLLAMTDRTNRKFLNDMNEYVASLRNCLRYLIMKRVTYPMSAPNIDDHVIQELADFLLCVEGPYGKISRNDFGSTPLYCSAGNMIATPNSGFEHPCSFPVSTFCEN